MGKKASSSEDRKIPNFTSNEERLEYCFKLAAYSARNIVKQHLTNAPGGISFQLHGETCRIPENSPPLVKEAAAYFQLMEISLNRDANDYQGIAEDHFFFGYLAATLPQSYSIGKCIDEMVQGKIKSQANLKKPPTSKLKLEAEQAIEAAKKEHSDRADDINFIKEVAAKSIGIKKNGLNKRLRK